MGGGGAMSDSAGGPSLTFAELMATRDGLRSVFPDASTLFDVPIRTNPYIPVGDVLWIHNGTMERFRIPAPDTRWRARIKRAWRELFPKPVRP